MKTPGDYTLDVWGTFLWSLNKDSAAAVAILMDEEAEDSFEPCFPITPIKEAVKWLEDARYKVLSERERARRIAESYREMLEDAGMAKDLKALPWKVENENV